MHLIRTFIIVILAGIAGTLANAFAASVAISPEKLNFIYVLGRYGVAIGVALFIPLIYHFVLSGKAGFIVSALVLTVAASLLAKLYFGAGAPWSLVLSLNLVYGVVATALYTILSRIFAPE